MQHQLSSTTTTFLLRRGRREVLLPVLSEAVPSPAEPSESAAAVADSLDRGFELPRSVHIVT